LVFFFLLNLMIIQIDPLGHLQRILDTNTLEDERLAHRQPVVYFPFLVCSELQEALDSLLEGVVAEAVLFVFGSLLHDANDIPDGESSIVPQVVNRVCGPAMDVLSGEEVGLIHGVGEVAFYLLARARDKWIQEEAVRGNEFVL
jgi:hypothetical protein